MNRFALILLACLAGSTGAAAQSYPTRTITLTVTAAAGGVTDVVARALGQRLSETWGQQVVIENKGGAAHVLGAQSVAKAAPDGYSLLVAEAGTFTINPTLYGKGKLPYDEEKDFSPVTGIVRINQALLGHTSIPATNVSELIALAKNKPGELTYRTAHEHGAVRKHGRREAPPRSLPGCGAGAHRRHRRPYQPDVGQREPRAAAVPRRADQAVRHRQHQTPRARSRHPNGRRERPAGLRSGDLVRVVRHRGHATRRRHEAQCRDSKDPGRPGLPRKIPGAADVRTDGQHA